MWTKFNLSIDIITKVSLLFYVIYVSAGALCICWKIDNIVKSTILGNNSHRRIQTGSLDGGMSDEYNGLGFVELAEIFVTQNDFFLWSRTIWQKDHVGYILDNLDELNWNVIRQLHITL